MRSLFIACLLTIRGGLGYFVTTGALDRSAILSVRLRQRGSPESKPVGAPHASTGVEG